MGPLKLFTRQIDAILWVMDHIPVGRKSLADICFGEVDVYDYTPQTHVSK